MDRFVPETTPADWLRSTANLFGHESRRVWARPGRAHVELKQVRGPEGFTQVAELLRRHVGGLEGVDSVDVNGAAHRAVVRFDPQRLTAEAVVEAIDAVERAHALVETFSEPWMEYPSDIEPLVRKLVHLGADAVGVGLGSLLTMCRYRPSKTVFDLAALTSILSNTPALRDRLVDLIGEPAFETLFSALSATSQAVASGPVSPLLDLVLQSLEVRGELWRRRAWLDREFELCCACESGKSGEAAQIGETIAPPQVHERPRPLPKGKIEAYSAEAWAASLGGFFVGLAETHDFETSLQPIFGGLPKAAKYGRDAFTSQLLAGLGDRGILTLRPEALKVLDRVDAVLIREETLFSGQLLLGDIVAVGERVEAQVRRQAGSLFDLDAPLATRVEGEWRMEPFDDFRGEVAEFIAEQAAELCSRWTPVLALSQGGSLSALVQLREALDPGTESLLKAIDRAGMHFVLAVEDGTPGQIGAPDEVVGTDDLQGVVRRLQRQGHVVAMVDDRPAGAMACSDLGIAVCRQTRRSPWTADLVCTDSLEDATYLIDACARARELADQSTTLTALGATFGAVMSLGGLDKDHPSRVMNAVNFASLLALLNGVRMARTVGREREGGAEAVIPWHMLDVHDVLRRVDSTWEGLSEMEAEARRPPSSGEDSRWRRIARAVGGELSNPFTPILAGGAGLSALVGSMGDAAMVGGVVGLNAAIGGTERYQAEKTIASLERREAHEVRGMRDGEEVKIPADEVAVGDVLLLEAGDVVPADGRILEAVDLEVDESSLTGESLPVSKDVDASYAAAVADRGSMLYAGTSIAAGSARMVAVAVGDQTEARRGRLAGAGEAPQTGVEARLEEITDLTLPAAMLAAALLFGSGMVRGRDLHRLVDTAVGMAVAAVPEGLPLLTTLAQLSAGRRLSQKGALIRNPRAIEALGRTDVLCADKTGTLTEGRIRLHTVSDGTRVAAADAANPWAAEILAAALRASPPPRTDGRAAPHPTDEAVMAGSRELGLVDDDASEGWERINQLPFEPGRGYHAVLGGVVGERTLCVKGAPEVLLARCELSEGERERLHAHAEELAAQGLRVLAVAEKEGGDEEILDDDVVDGLSFRGFVGLSDPVRASSADAIRRLREAGIDVMMMTGDHPRTARRIAEELGLMNGVPVLTGPEIEAMSDAELDEVLPGVRVIARVTPRQKVRIVKSLQHAGLTVAMTGDGANDAAAIRLADVGIAAGQDSTEAAREAADVVLTDERIDTIVDAIAEGRAMWESVRDAVALLVGGNLGEIGFTLTSGLFAKEPSLTVRQLLLVNLLTDVWPALAIALKPPSEESLEHLLQKGPAETMGSELDREIALRAVATASGAMAGWTVASVLPGSRKRASTVGLLSLVGTQLGQTLTSGEPTRHTVAASLGSAAILLGIVETPGISQAFGCTPLGPVGLATAAGSSVAATAAASLYHPVRDRVHGYLEKTLARLEAEEESAPVGEIETEGLPLAAE